MSKAHVIDVNQQNFGAEVLRKSLDVPVLVDFWAEWCGPCRSLTPILEKLAAAYAGRFILAKCNSDENADLVRQFGIRGIPSCKLFKDGALAGEFQGAQPESELRRFLDSHCADPAEKPLEVARQYLAAGEADQALELVQAALREDPQDLEARLLLGRVRLRLHDFVGASQALADFPPGHSEAQRLQQMIEYASLAAKYGSIEQCAEKVKQHPDDLEARYQWGIVLSLDDRYEEAMDRFLEVIARNKNYGDGKVRQAMLALLEVLGPDNPATQQYRRKFANLVL